MAAFDYAQLRGELPRYETASWSVARLTLLIDGHAQGLSFNELGLRTKATKNAAIGQAHRLELPKRMREDGTAPGRTALARKRRVRQERKAAAPKPVLPPKPSREEIRHLNLSDTAKALALPAMSLGLISDLAATQCKWPVGDPRADDFGFCGRLKTGKNYCAAHHAASVNPFATRRAYREDLALQKAVTTGRAA